MRFKRRLTRLWLQLPRWPYLCLLLVIFVGVIAHKYVERAELMAKFAALR